MLLIGKHVKILKSRNESQVGLSGVVVDETKNMIIIETGSGKKKIFKAQAVFLFSLPRKSLRIEGKLIVGRLEDRVKKWQKVQQKLGTLDLM